ncbi:MAG: phosphate ABC transporter permease subunit PstC, partial [Acidobacteriota bacterium]|nr:phosphate ABC transporter permease subunit PstC [Acidobacteriota bacterium]
MSTRTLAPRPARGALRLPKGEWIIERVLFLCAALSVFTTIGIIAVLAFETFEFLRVVPLVDFLTGT